MRYGKLTYPFLAGILIGCLPLVSPLAADSVQREEIVVSFQIRRLLTADLFVWYDGESIYLPASDIFDLLDLRLDADLKNGIIEGFVIDPAQTFRFDLNTNEATIAGKREPLSRDDYLITETGFYLRLDRFETCFGLPMAFSFSDLRVTLPLNEDFPAYRKLQRSLAHKQLQTHEEQLRDVRRLPYRRAMLGGAVVDWSLSATPIGGGAQYFNLSSGAMLAGGDLTLSGTGNSETGLDSDQLSGRWHYFVSPDGLVTQFELGDLFTGGSGGPLTRPLRGAAVTNRPQTQRTFFRTVTIEGHLGEGWEVELYIDQKLTAFMYTDENGRYEFNVDLYYGASVVTLKMYGPNGEIRTEEQYIRVPYNLIPERTLEYALLVGRPPHDTISAWYGQANAFYGINRRLTTGLGIDIPLGSQAEEPPAFEAQTTFQPMGNLTLSGSYSPDYVAGLNFNYNKPSVITIDGSAALYFENEFRNRLRREGSAVLSVSSPLSLFGRRTNVRTYLSWNRFTTSEQIALHYGFNTSLSRFNLYYLGKYRIQSQDDRSQSNLHSELFASVQLLRWLRPQFRITYDHTENELSRISIYLSRRLFSTGQLAFGAEHDFPSATSVFRLTFSLFTDFADFSSRAAYSRGAATLNQVQHGSVRYDQEAKQLLFDRYSGVGRSTAVVRPFRDDNFNGILDEGEPPIPGLRARVQGGRERRRDDRSVYYYEGLNPYDEHLVRIDPMSLDNPLLKPIYEGYRVPLNPNMVTPIHVPLVITGEVEGMVRRRTPAGESGIGGVKVQFYHQAKESVTEVMTFANGDFFYLGLIPGRYRAYVDPAQLQRLGYRSDPEYIEFELEAIEDGGLVGDLNFLLIPAVISER